MMMTKSIVVVALGCALAGPVFADGLGVSIGMDTLSLGGVAASVPTVGVAVATHVRGVGVSEDMRAGRGDGTTLEAMHFGVAGRGWRIGEGMISPHARVGGYSMDGPGVASLSTGTVSAGVTASAPLTSRITGEAQADIGATFEGTVVSPRGGTASGSGTVRSLRAALAYRVSAHGILAASYTYRRLPVGPVALEDHNTRAAYIYRF
ncbi:MAG: hypothetical protein ACYCQK_02710 [Acidiferrobacteraceae bacterium]